MIHLSAAVSAISPAPAAPAATGASFSARLRTHARGPAPRTTHAGDAGGVAGAAREALASVEQARARLDAVVAAARAGRTFTAQELLALQAQAYRYSQTVEVASRVVEQAVQSVKQAVNTPV